MMTDYQNQPVLIPLIFFTWLCKDHFYTVKKKKSSPILNITEIATSLCNKIFL